MISHSTQNFNLSHSHKSQSSKPRTKINEDSFQNLGINRKELEDQLQAKESVEYPEPSEKSLNSPKFQNHLKYTPVTPQHPLKILKAGSFQRKDVMTPTSTPISKFENLKSATKGLTPNPSSKQYRSYWLDRVNYLLTSPKRVFYDVVNLSNLQNTTKKIEPSAIHKEYEVHQLQTKITLKSLSDQLITDIGYFRFILPKVTISLAHVSKINSNFVFE